jgi:serine protease Do
MLKPPLLRSISGQRIEGAMLRLVMFLCLLFAASASAEPLPLLKANEHWLVVASTTNLDTAKGIAGHFIGEDAKIVSSESGYFAVVFGPFPEPTVAQVKRKHAGLSQLPADAMLSRGSKYKEIVWRENVEVIGQGPLAVYGRGKPLQLSSGGLNVEVSVGPGAEDASVDGPTQVVGKRNGTEVFRFTLSTEDVGAAGSEAGFVKLDPTSDEAQLVVTRYTGGTHCCTQYWFITKPSLSGGYVLIEGTALDGGGYSFRDLDGDGAMELINADNRFLYAFDSYAGSYAPLIVSQLRGTSINEITSAPVASALRAENDGFLEFAPKIEPATWRTNGFLAAWVAVKARAGLGDDAWQTMLENYDRNSTFGPMTCLTGQAIEQCPGDKLQTIPFPKALAKFIQDTDYGPLPPAAQNLLP